MKARLGETNKQCVVIDGANPSDTIPAFVNRYGIEGKVNLQMCSWLQDQKMGLMARSEKNATDIVAIINSLQN